MKRLTSILCALMVLISATATPQLGKKLAVEKQKNEQNLVSLSKTTQAAKPDPIRLLLI